MNSEQLRTELYSGLWKMNKALRGIGGGGAQPQLRMNLALFPGSL